MTAYVPRVIDSELGDDLAVMGAVLLEGPKAVGKTATASQVARTVYRLDTDDEVRTLMETDARRVLNAPGPILLDEWQELPTAWNLVRRAVDDQASPGRFILTGSATPRDETRMHSGAGRIARLRMRPMSLAETGHSTREVSIQALLDGETPDASPSTLSIDDLFERMVVGGWPAVSEWNEKRATRWMRNYLTNVAEVDLPALGPRRRPDNIARLLAALGRSVGTPLNRRDLEREVGGDNGPIASETLTHYLSALERLMLVEPLPAWKPHMRSRVQSRVSPVHHFVDPAVGLAALRVSVSGLGDDLRAAGLHFESLVLRDLRVYAQNLGATLSSWRDTRSGREVDVILELPDGRWAAIEIKLGEGATDAAADSLTAFARSVDTSVHRAPAALIVVNAGRFTYRRPDGVVVVPIGVLGP